MCAGDAQVDGAAFQLGVQIMQHARAGKIQEGGSGKIADDMGRGRT